MSISITPSACQHLPLLFIVAILVYMKCYPTVVVVCIPLLTNDGEHLFLLWLVICVSSFVNVHIFCLFFLGYLPFYYAIVIVLCKI